jgi:hypothetical protein
MLGAWRLRAKLEALRTTLSERKAQRRAKQGGSQGGGGGAHAPPPGDNPGGKGGGGSRFGSWGSAHDGAQDRSRRRFGSWGSAPPSSPQAGDSPQAGEAECAERPLGGDAISPLNLLNLDGATCTKLEVKRSCRLKARESHPSCMHVLTTASSPALQVKRSYRLKAREYHPDKYAGSKSCAEMHFHSLRAAQEAALLMCK